MKYKILLFDLDGTIFDYDKAESKALEKTFQQFCIAFKPEYLSEYRKFNKQVWREFEYGNTSQNELKIKRFRDLSDSMGLKIDTHKFSDCYLKNLSERTDLLEGAEEVLKSLYENHKLFLITNGLKDVQRPRINLSAIKEYFDDIIISEEVGFAKPDSKIFDIAFERMNHPQKEEVLLIGDGITSDMQGGINYGIDTCWYNPDKLIPPNGFNITYEIQALNELLKFC